jgi:hypothetical protein
MQDEVDGKMYQSLMVSGKSKVKVPAVFNEVWIADCDEVKDSKDPNHTHDYYFCTRPSGRIRARSRIESLGNLPSRIPQDICKALKNCGYDTTPKGL